MMRKVLNFGSLNIDHVYKVPHIVYPGETLSSTDYAVFCGGKGGNQSIALARAGAVVSHAGCIGPDGENLAANLAHAGVDIEYVVTTDTPSGHAVIQVSSSGENAIVLFPGANHKVTETFIDDVLSNADAGDMLLLQNEINNIGLIMQKAVDTGLEICFNFAPFDHNAAEALPLHLVNILVVNETEAKGLTGYDKSEEALNELAAYYPETIIILTLGADGAMLTSQGKCLRFTPPKVEVNDTTAAGDTFIGYFIAAYLRGEKLQRCLEESCTAGAIAVSRYGAAESIPFIEQIKPYLQRKS